MDAADKACPQCGQAVTAQAGKPSSRKSGQMKTVSARTSAEHATLSEESDRWAGALAYLVIFAVVFLVLEPYNRNRFVRFHSFQALFLTCAAIVGQVLVQALAAVIGGMGLLFVAYTFGLFVLTLWLMFRAIQGDRFQIPYIGGLADKYA